MLLSASAQAQQISLGPRLAALAAPVAISDVRWNPANPASSAEIDASYVTVHAERPYHIDGLYAGGAGAGLVLDTKAILVALRSHGYEDFRQTTVALAGTFRIGVAEEVAAFVGVRGRTAWAAPRGYPAQRDVALDAGWLVDVGLPVRIGGAIRRLAHGGSSSSVLLPMVVSAGFVVAAGSSVDLYGQVHHEQGRAPSTGFGIEAEAPHRMSIRTGLTLVPAQLCGGIGIRLTALQIDLALVYHAELGFSSGIAVTGMRRAPKP